MLKGYEKLGAFYLGRRFDPDSGEIAAEPLLYDASDLTTHAVIIGMTGSGKTGLGVCLLEEALIDQVPVIAIDPKGDLGNLLLNFPQLRGADFSPWVDPGAARAQGLDREAFATAQAKLWRKGLADWDQDGERVARLGKAAEMAIYTPGSTAGQPLSILGSLRAPPSALVQDAEMFAQRVQAAVTGLLTLLGIDADPLSSREHILLSTLFAREWRAGRDLDLAALVGAIPQPGIDKLGILPLDTVFPPKDRMALALRLNNLLASPGFSAWLSGTPLDAQGLLYTAQGRPRLSIVNIAHLSDAERMSVVTLLLAEVLNWVRSQPGTGSLRAVLYMDEIFGYLPPNANPPSKMLLLTLLKQARAFGLGLVLSTQNPVDLDYKALSNAGTWFIGRLQTDQDRARVLDGLRAGGADVQQLSRWLSGLGKRRFLLHNVHESRPGCFATRWALSYLAGPLAREQIQRLSPADTPLAVASPAQHKAPAQAASSPPALPAGIKPYYLPARRSPAPGERLMYQPRLLAAVDVHYVSARHKVENQCRLLLALALDDGPLAPDWADAALLDIDPERLAKRGASGAAYADLPQAMLKSGAVKRWPRELSRHIRTERPLQLWRCAALKLNSVPGESEGEFRVRLRQAASEHRDREVARLRTRYEKRLATLEARLLRAEQAIERESQQSRAGQVDAALSFGGALLGAFLGRRKVSATNVRRVSSAARRAGRLRKQAGDVDRAEQRASVVQEQIAQLGRQFEDEVDQLELDLDSSNLSLEPIHIRAKSSDIQVHFVTLGWLPRFVAA